MNTGDDGQYHEIKHQSNKEIARGQGEAKPRPAENYNFPQQPNLLQRSKNANQKSQNANQVGAFRGFSSRASRNKAEQVAPVTESKDELPEEVPPWSWLWKFFDRPNS